MTINSRNEGARGMAYICQSCGAKLCDLTWVADYHQSEKGASEGVWRTNSQYGYALKKGFCLKCGSDKITEVTHDN